MMGDDRVDRTGLGTQRRWGSFQLIFRFEVDFCVFFVIFLLVFPAKYFSTVLDFQYSNSKLTLSRSNPFPAVPWFCPLCLVLGLWWKTNEERNANDFHK